MLSLVLLILCAGALASTVPKNTKPNYNLEDAEALFEDFIKTYKRVYLNDNEKGKRFEIFKKTLEDINRMNSDPNETAHFDINKFADLELEEFKRLYTGFIAPPNTQSPVNVTVKPVDIKLLDSFDWRQQGAVTGVKNQGRCGSCWTFATTGTVEGAYAIKHGQLQEFSEQQIVDCANGGGCNGGRIDQALEYLQQAGGSETEYAYPYTGVQGQCSFNRAQVQAQVTGIIPADMQSEDALAQQLQSTGPIGIGVDATSLKTYRGDVLQNCINERVDHAVLLVGYGSVDKLGDMDVVIHNDLTSIMLLYSLPGSYENFRCAMESRDCLPAPDMLKIKILEVRHVPTGSMIADILTKPLPVAKHMSCVAGLGIKPV